MKNWGYEFSAEAFIIRKSNLSWSVDANISLVNNKVTALYKDKDITGAYNIIRVGESISSISHGNMLVSMRQMVIHYTKQMEVVQANIPNIK